MISLLLPMSNCAIWATHFVFVEWATRQKFTLENHQELTLRFLDKKILSYFFPISLHFLSRLIDAENHLHRLELLLCF